MDLAGRASCADRFGGRPGRRALTKKPVIPPASLTDLILGFPSVYILGHAPASQVGLATQLSPTFVIIWIGANDTLGGYVTGNPNLVVPAAAFAQLYPAIVGSIAQTGAKMVLANLPDALTVPALSKGSDLAAQGMPIAKFGMGPDDYATPYSHEHIKLILEGKDSGPLGPGEILHAGDIPTLQAIVNADNQVIAAVGAQFHAPVVDIYSLFNKTHKKGYRLANGTILTFDYLGGIFGLDGVHPTVTGQAILAKAFIKTINAYYGTNLKVPNITKANLSDPEGIPTAGALPLNVPAEMYQEFVSSPSLQQ
ncbi:MAG: hypothetical protein B7X11_03105 [Acidobacteria bacterium 37-65-4]|nr:MAG: hypothetical protein B7X11_03105 [Acidobacteria bacterium 37-65-4]